MKQILANAMQRKFAQTAGMKLALLKALTKHTFGNIGDFATTAVHLKLSIKQKNNKIKFGGIMKIDTIKTMLSAIDKHANIIANKSKYNENKTLADCVLALSAIIKDVLKID